MHLPIRHALLIVALVALPSLAALHSRSFFSPDETYYAEVAREMTESGDLIVPHFDGKPFLEKPPLVYWMLAGAFSALGWGLPAAVALNTALTLLTALLVLLHTRRTSSSRAGLFAAVAYATMLLPAAASRTALTDPTLTVCTTGAIVAFLVATWPGAVAAGVFLGLGILAKGPVAPLVVLPALAAAALVRDRRRSLARLGTALAVAVMVAAPWHVMLAGRGLLGAYLEIFLGRQVVSRALDVWRQQQPWWFYLPVLWIAVFPWGTHLVLAVRRWWRDLRSVSFADPAGAAEAAAIAVPLIAFSLAVNKFPHYLLPMLPWLAVWLGRAADRIWDPDRTHRLVERLAPLAGLLAAAALAALAFGVARSPFSALLPPATVPVLALGAAGYVLLSLRGRTHRRLAWGAAAGIALGLHTYADVALIPALDAHSLERPLALAVRNALPSGGLPIAYRWFRPSLVTYGVRGWDIAESSGDLRRALDRSDRESRRALVTTRADLEGEARATLWNRGGEARELARVRGLGELDGAVLEGIVFAAADHRDGTRWFYDADRKVAGESGFSEVGGNRWTPTFRFTVTAEARLVAPARPPGPATVRLRAWGLPDPDGVPESIEVSLNGTSLGEIELDRFPGVFSLPVPASALTDGGQVLTFTNQHLVQPRLVEKGNTDDRELGFALDWISLDPARPTLDLVATPVDGVLTSPQ